MNYKGLPLHAVQRVAYTEAQQYALSRGWQRVQGVKGDMAVYRRPDSKKWEVVIPQDRGFSDYSLRMAEALAAFTDFERLENDHRTVRQVMNDLLLPAADIIRFSLEGSSAQDGTVSLGQAVNLITGGRKALIASACTVVQPQKFHPRMSRTEAEQFINACRLGQTEEGSFVTTFICPLNAVPNDELLLPGVSAAPADSFTRKVTRTLVRSLNQVVEAVKADHPEALLSPKETDVIISANLCEALLELQPDIEESLVSIYPSWARTIPPPTETPIQIRLSKEYFPILEDIARHLRPAQGSKEDFFIGWVDALDGKPGPDRRPQGDVTLAIPFEERLLKARLVLSVDDYAKAIKAHATNSVVMLRGVLHRGARISVIKSYREFEVIDEVMDKQLTEGIAMHETPPPYNAPKPPPDEKK